MNKPYVSDRFSCCGFSQVMVSTPQAADRNLTDRRAGVRAIVDSQKVDLCENLTESEPCWNGNAAILSSCQGRAHERRGDRERETDGKRGQAPTKPV